MSLEQAIQDLTVEIMNLTQALNKANGTAVELNQPAMPKETKAKKVEKEAPAAIAPSISREQLFDKLKEHGKAFGLATTKQLMVKHGADKAAPATTNLPLASYQKCYDDAVKELNAGQKQEVFE